jgi:beta-N-acetylhexosaminidase
VSRPAPDYDAALITSLAGPVLTPDERAFLRDARPAGVILMGRNCVDPVQLRALTDDIRNGSGRSDIPILVDQEGGRVQRLAPPHWPQYAPAGSLNLAQTRAQAAAIAADLAAAGITHNCTPVLDVPAPGAHGVIGDRAFARNPAAMGRAVAQAHLAAGITPIMKHIPGHGRARADSHHALPVVDAPLEALRATDFAPFRALADIPGLWAMTAHITYTALDPALPASASPAVINTIRAEMQFTGTLLSDDLEMAALAPLGPLPARARACLTAGCDLVLYCGGDLRTAQTIATHCI